MSTLLNVVLVVTVTLFAVQAREIRGFEVSYWNRSCEKEDCQLHAYCDKFPGDTHGFCVCLDNTVKFEHDCLPEAKKPGDTCSTPIQCTKKLGANAYCAGTKCKCSPGSHFIPQGTCHKFVKIGENCTEPNDCFSARGAPVSCEDGKCQCGQGYHPNEDSNDCVLHIKLGAHCTIPDECVANATCTYTCNCYSGLFFPSSDNERCLPFVNKLDDECEENAQCNLPNTVCRNYKCGCKIGTAVHEGIKCVESKGLGTYCDSNALCTTDKSKCREGICSCKEGWVNTADNKRCIEAAKKYKAECEEPRQCTEPFGEHAECKEKRCVCHLGYFFSEKKCLKDKVLKSPCESSVECHIAKHGKCQRMECISGLCVCKQGFEEDPHGDCSGVSPQAAGGVSIVAAMGSLLFLIITQILEA